MAQTRPVQLRVRLANNTSGSEPQIAASLTWPGRIEKLIVCLTLFLLSFDLPNFWFQNRDERIAGEIVRGGDAKTLALFLILFFLSFSRLVNNGNLVLAAMRREKYLLGFLLWISVSVLWSADPALSARRSISLTLTTAFAFFLVVRFPLRDILALSIAAFGTGTLFSYVLILGFPAAGVSRGGWIGMFDNKNSLGRHEVLATVVFLVGAACLRRWRVPILFLACASITLVFGAGSATAIVGLLAVLGNFVVFRMFRAKDTLFGAVGLSLVSTGVAAVAVAYGNLSVLTRLLGKDITLTGRTQLWEIVWLTIGDRPFTGHGWDAYWTGFHGPSHEVWIEAPWLPPHAHNALLDYLLVIGIPGALLFVALFLRATVRSTRFIRDTTDGTQMFPIMMMTYAFVFSLTEAGVVGRHERWTLFVVAIVAAAQTQTQTSTRVDRPSIELITADITTETRQKTQAG